jgi:hypothetical protein
VPGLGTTGLGSWSFLQQIIDPEAIETHNGTAFATWNLHRNGAFDLTLWKQ